MRTKCSQADIAHNYVNRSKDEQRTRTNVAHSNKQMAERKHPISKILLEIKFAVSSVCLRNDRKNSA